MYPPPAEPTPRQTGVLCLTFDNMGRAMDVGAGKTGAPDPHEASLAIGYPRLLGLLDRLGLKGTFFIEGWNCLHHPDRVLDLVRQGHEVGLHGWVHERFAQLERVRAEQVIHDGTAAFERLGLRPSGFRAPGGIRGPHAEKILVNLGYRYDSSTEIQQQNDPEDDGSFVTPCILPCGLVHVPWRYAMVDSIQYLRRMDRPRTPGELEKMWMTVIDGLARARATTTMVVHAYVSGVDDQRFAVVSNVLAHARQRGDIDILTAATVAERTLSTRQPSMETP